MDTTTRDVPDTRPAINPTTDPAVNPAVHPTVVLGGDLPVTRVGLGTMRLTDASARHLPAAEAEIWSTDAAERAAGVALLREAVEAGVDFVDTADAYALGAGESVVAEALAPFGDRVAVATKVGLVRPGPREWVALGHPAYLRQQAELSLRRLRRDVIDLLYLHRVDPAVPLAEQVGALAQLREEGKVRHIGLSEVDAGELAAALDVAPVAAVQNLYNVGARGHDAVLELAAARGVAFVAFFPVGVGELARGTGTVARVAREVGATPAQVALAWLLHRSPATVAIPGTRSPAHVRENLGALGVRLGPEQLARLDALGG